MDLVINFLLEVVFFSVGKTILWACTAGKYRPKLNDRSQPLVTFVGAVVVLGGIVIAGFVLNN